MEILFCRKVFLKWAIPGLFFFIFVCSIQLKQMFKIIFADDWIQTLESEDNDLLTEPLSLMLNRLNGHFTYEKNDNKRKEAVAGPH